MQNSCIFVQPDGRTKAGKLLKGAFEMTAGGCFKSLTQAVAYIRDQ